MGTCASKPKTLDVKVSEWRTACPDMPGQPHTKLTLPPAVWLCSSPECSAATPPNICRSTDCARMAPVWRQCSILEPARSIFSRGAFICSSRLFYASAGTASSGHGCKWCQGTRRHRGIQRSTCSCASGGGGGDGPNGRGSHGAGARVCLCACRRGQGFCQPGGRDQW